MNPWAESLLMVLKAYAVALTKQDGRFSNFMRAEVIAERAFRKYGQRPVTTQNTSEMLQAIYMEVLDGEAQEPASGS